MIILLILITSSHDNVWISLGENCCWSLLALKGLNLLKMLGQYLCLLTARFFAGKCDLFLLFTWCDSHQTVVVIHISIGSTHGCKNFWTHLWADTFTDAINIGTMGKMVAFLHTARISYKYQQNEYVTLISWVHKLWLNRRWRKQGEIFSETTNTIEPPLRGLPRSTGKWPLGRTKVVRHKLA